MAQIHCSATDLPLFRKPYFESDLNSTSYLDTDQDFEILGNNPANPLGFTSSDPTRAVVRLSFRKGQLSNVALVKAGSDYQQLASAILERNGTNLSTVATPGDPENKSLLVGVNIDLEAQYTLAASRPTGSDPYHDWYLVTDTGLASAQARVTGAFGAVDVTLQARSQRAQEILNITPITTGYSGKGVQNKIHAPDSGEIRLIDRFGSEVGNATVAAGKAAVTLQSLPAPGALKLAFEGDARSSYLVNFRGITLDDNVQVNLNYGQFSGPIQLQGQHLQLTTEQALQVIRSDSRGGLGNLWATAV